VRAAVCWGATKQCACVMGFELRPAPSGLPGNGSGGACCQRDGSRVRAVWLHVHVRMRVRVRVRVRVVQPTSSRFDS
jgi:hypothetical protein